MIGCYNSARNDPYKDARHPRYTFLEKWPDSRITELGKAEWERLRLGLEMAAPTEAGDTTTEPVDKPTI